MEPIASYVIIDVETTGLQGSHYGRTKITEICLVGVITNHFKFQEHSKTNSALELEIPRVKTKLTMCFQPEKDLTVMSEKNSGLKNELLDELKPFNNNFCDMLKNFIQSLPQPVCLLAHNGIRHDFPLLQAHTKIRGKPLPDNLLCADTLEAFTSLKESGNSNFWPKTKSNITPSRSQPASSKVQIDEANSPENDYQKKKEAVDKTPNSLNSIHRLLFDEDIPNAHTAEGDTEALLKCIAAYGKSFHDFVQNNCIKFNNIQKCW